MTCPMPCPVGYYCPEGTDIKTSNPCPASTYMPYDRAASLIECIDCDLGMYCGEDGLSEPSGECEGGYYCTGAASSAAPRNDSVSTLCLSLCYDVQLFSNSVCDWLWEW